MLAMVSHFIKSIPFQAKLVVSLCVSQTLCNFLVKLCMWENGLSSLLNVLILQL